MFRFEETREHQIARARGSFLTYIAQIPRDPNGMALYQAFEDYMRALGVDIDELRAGRRAKSGALTLLEQDMPGFLTGRPTQGGHVEASSK